MQIQFHQTNQFNHFNSRFVNSACKSNVNTSAHSRRRMLESQDQVKETEAVRVTISGEAMALARQAKAMERQELAEKRLLQFTNANVEEIEEASASAQREESEESIQLTDEEKYEELLNQVEIWGDKTFALRYDYNHQETAEMAEKRAAALTELQNLEELQKSEISKQQREAQKAAEQASMQQEQINKKSSELIMMIESFKDHDEEEAKKAEGEDGKEGETTSTGSLMEGEIGAMAAKREMGMLSTVDTMERSGADRLAASYDSLRGVETERRNIYRVNDAKNFTTEEKIAEMEHFVCMLANNEDVKDSFMERIEKETDPDVRKKLQAKMDYFDQMDMKNGYQGLKLEREFALQERINARDLRIAHLGDRHLVMAEQQKKELQSLFDEDDIMRTQGQGSVTSRTEDIAERLQDELDERDHVDEDAWDKEELKKEELKKEELKDKELEKEKTEKEEKEKDDSESDYITDKDKSNQ